MVAYNKYNVFVRDLVDGVHDFTASTGDTFKVGLTNTAPSATHALRSDTTELSTAGGYTSGGNTSTMSVGLSGGTATVTAADPAVWTGSTPGFTFAHAFLYNDTTTEGPVDPLIAYWSYGSSQAVGNLETLTVDFDAGTGIFTIA